MSDPITDQRLSFVYPDLAARWRRVNQSMIDLHKMPMRVSDGIRTLDEQLAVYAKGRTQLNDGTWEITDKSKIVTYAPPYSSYHLYGLALDSVFLGSDPYLALLSWKERDFLYSEYGRFCKAFGLEWGGDWAGVKQDRPHCQITYGLSLSEIRRLYTIKGNISVWTRCNQITGVDV